MNTNQTFTELETKVFNLLVEEMVGNGILDTQEIAEALELDVKTVKGVLGSLTKKGKVDCEDVDVNGHNVPIVWPVHPVIGVCFWADEISKEEILAARIGEEEDASASSDVEKIPMVWADEQTLDDKNRCACCDRIISMSPHVVTVADGGDSVIRPEDEDRVDPAGLMGNFEVGPTCAKRHFKGFSRRVQS